MRNSKLFLSMATATTMALSGALLSGCLADAPIKPAEQAMQANFTAVSQVAAKGHQFEVTARLTPEGAVKVGEAMVLQVHSARAGRVWVLSVDAADNVGVLFPNAAYRDNAIKADTVTKVPPDGSGARMIVAEPRGKNRVLVVVTAPDQTLDSVLSTAGGLRLVAKPDDLGWAATMLEFTVQ